MYYEYLATFAFFFILWYLLGRSSYFREASMIIIFSYYFLCPFSETLAYLKVLEPSVEPCQFAFYIQVCVIPRERYSLENRCTCLHLEMFILLLHSNFFLCYCKFNFVFFPTLMHVNILDKNTLILYPCTLLKSFFSTNCFLMDTVGFFLACELISWAVRDSFAPLSLPPSLPSFFLPPYLSSFSLPASLPSCMPAFLLLHVFSSPFLPDCCDQNSKENGSVKSEHPCLPLDLRGEAVHLSSVRVILAVGVPQMLLVRLRMFAFVPNLNVFVDS